MFVIDVGDSASARRTRSRVDPRPLHRQGRRVVPACRTVGYSFNSEKIFCNKEGVVTRVPYVEHVPPDVTAAIFWLKNGSATCSSSSTRSASI